MGVGFRHFGGLRRNRNRGGVYEVRSPETGMSKVEALEIVLSMSRELSHVDEFEWTDDNTEACNVVDTIMHAYMGEVE